MDEATEYYNSNCEKIWYHDLIDQITDCFNMFAVHENIDILLLDLQFEFPY